MKEERRNKMICFHDPDKEYGFLSNWYMSDFIEDGKLYTSVEQYLMYGKAVVFKDEEMFAHGCSSSIFNNLVFHTGAFDSAGMIMCIVRLPVREVICFFLVGITMANDDVFEDIAAAGGKRADVVESRVISTVRIPAGGFFHQPSGIIIRLLLRAEKPVPHVYGLIL